MYAQPKYRRFMTWRICRCAGVLDQAVEAVLECVCGFTVFKKILQREEEANNYTHTVLEHLGSVLCNRKNNDCSS